MNCWIYYAFVIRSNWIYKMKLKLLKILTLFGRALDIHGASFHPFPITILYIYRNLTVGHLWNGLHWLAIFVMCKMRFNFFRFYFYFRLRNDAFAEDEGIKKNILNPCSSSSNIEMTIWKTTLHRNNINHKQVIVFTKHLINVTKPLIG